jgi:hypothetical protein
VRPRTFESYCLNVRRVAPHLGRLKLRALEPAIVQGAYPALVKRGLSKRSVEQAHAVLHRALRQAMMWVCRYVACVTSSCGLSILREETAKAIAALHPAVRQRRYFGRFAWSALPKTLVRSSLVIVLDELVQYPRQMLSPED